MSGSGTGFPTPSPSDASRRMWLQRWIAQGLLTPAQAQGIEEYEGANAAALAAYDTGSADQVLRGWVQRWATVGYITAQQAAAINADISVTQQPGAYGAPPAAPVPGANMPPAPGAHAPPPAYSAPTPSAAPRASGVSGLAVVSELLGYLGATLAIAASFWLMRNVWSDFEPVLQAVITGVVAVILTGAGFLIRIEGVAAFKRLRIVVWLASTAVTGAFGAVIAVQFIPTEYPPTVTAVIGACVALQSVALWQFRRRAAQQITTLLGVIVAVSFGAGVAFDLPSTGVIIFGIGAVLLGVGFADRVRISAITLTAGAITMLIAPFPVMVNDPGPALVAGSVISGAMMLIGLIKAIPLRTERRLIIGISGAVAGMMFAPLTIAYFIGSGATGIGIVAVLIGLALVGLAVSGMTYVPEVAEIVGAIGVIVGIAVVGADAPGAAPLCGILLAIVGIVLGNRFSRIGLTVVSWIGLALFSLWQLIWVGVRVNIGAVAALIAGAALVAAAVILSRRAAGRARREREAAESEAARSPQPPMPPRPPTTWQ